MELMVQITSTSLITSPGYSDVGALGNKQFNVHCTIDALHRLF